MTDAKNRPHYMPCPDCGSRMDVEDTTHLQNGSIKRKRVCTKCKREIRTIEEVVPSGVPATSKTVL